MLWADTTAGIMKMRNGANSAFISLWELDGTFIATDISLSAGTAAAPSLYFTGDTNTGIYSPGADQVAISTNGTGRLTIDASGNVNIDSNTLYVDAVNNRVGLGTSSPSSSLHIVGTGVINAATGTGGILYQAQNSDVSALGYFGTEGNTAGATLPGTLANATLISSGASGTALQFGTGGNIRATLTSTGLGIGTTTPTDTNGYGTTLDIRGSGTGNGGVVYLGNSDATVRGQLAVYGDGRMDFGTATNHPLKFYTFNSERGRFTNDGKFLVGTSTASSADTSKTEIYGGGIDNTDGGGNQVLLRKNEFTAGNQTAHMLRLRSGLASQGQMALGLLTNAGGQTLGFIDQVSGVGTIFAQGGTERFRIGNAGQLGIGGATYGTSGQVLTSGGASAAPSWQDAGGGAGTLKAWVNFNGTGTVAIRASGNVSSITDNGTGSYTVNFTTAMADANYSANVSIAGVPGTSDACMVTTDMNNASRVNPTTTTFTFTAYRLSGSAIDTEFVRVAIFR